MICENNSLELHPDKCDEQCLIASYCVAVG